MKKTILTSIIMMGLFVGCGSDSSSSSNNTTTESVDSAKKNMKALGSIESLNFGKILGMGSASSTTSTSSGIQKLLSRDCPTGGTMEYDDVTFAVTYNSCKSPSGTLNGSISIDGDPDSDNFTMSFNNLTYVGIEGSSSMNFTMKSQKNASTTTMTINGNMDSTDKDGKVNNMDFSNMTMVDYETASESWSKIDGKINIESSCFSGTYAFSTIQKLVDARDGTDNLESGVLNLNGATYTFSNPYVTIKAGSEERTITQQELDREMSNTTECS